MSYDDDEFMRVRYGDYWELCTSCRFMIVISAITYYRCRLKEYLVSGKEFYQSLPHSSECVLMLIFPWY